MAKDEIVIKVDSVSKTFKLPHEKQSSIKGLFVNVFRRNKTYEVQEALKNISFEVKKGEFFGIVGKNGSGKSTLLKLLARIYTPTDGKMLINGKLTPFIELGVGFNMELTGKENVYLNGALLGFSRKEMADMYDEIVEFAELEKFMDQKLKNYSSGMQVRLAFSIAIRAQNQILILDEVLAVGDAAFQKKCFDYFASLKKNKQTVVLVTHDMGAVQEFCDRAMMLQDSEVIDIGEPRKIALRYEMANTASVSNSQQGKTLQRPKDPNIKISQLRFKSKEKTTSNFSVKNDITVEIDIEVKRPTEVQINLFFLRSNGAYLAGVNSTKDLGASYKPTKGKHTLKCKIRAGQLIKGEYDIGAGIYTPGYMPEIIDVIDKNYDSSMPRIKIVDKSLYQDGEFYIDGKWSTGDSK